MQSFTVAGPLGNMLHPHARHIVCMPRMESAVSLRSKLCVLPLAAALATAGAIAVTATPAAAAPASTPICTTAFWLGITADGTYGNQTRDHINFLDINGNCHKWG